MIHLYSIDNLTVNEYLEKLAEPNFPGPASGSAAATIAAMAAALLEMSCEVTMKKDEQQSNLMETIKDMKEMRKHCLFLATEDMTAYAEVVRAMKAKKESPEKYEEAMKNATDTLVAIVKDSHSILTQIEKVIKTCFIKIWGDLAGSTYMAEAAAAAAKQGVEINLRLLHDERYKEEVQNLVLESYRNCAETKDRIIATRTF
ncbi:MAG: cyclodeaminase/cyclohydrolase family protein [Bacillota bacterium]|nr:cyclodeaminase/cyclohydrolase family protein [Bacillota bacterium]